MRKLSLKRIFRLAHELLSRTCDDLGLIEDDLLGDAALPLVQLLTDAGDDTETGLQSVGCLLTNELMRHKRGVI